MRQITKHGLAAIAIALVLGSICSVIVTTAMIYVNRLYPGWGSAMGLAIIVGIFGCAFVAFERGWLD